MKNTENKKILITGGGGYIGVVATEELLKKGYQVKVLDTLYWGREPLKHLLNKIELVQQDIRIVSEDVLDNVNTVIHTAGLSNDPMADFNSKSNFEVNTIATVKFAKLCKRKGVKKFIFASSASIYDSDISGQILQDENFPVKPIAAYSLSKYKAEKKLINLSSKKFCVVVFRQGTVYGYSPRLRYDLVVNTMVKDSLLNKKIRVFCKGEQWRPLVDVNDIAKAYILAIETKNQKICGEIFNLLYENYKIIDIANLISSTFRKYFHIKIKIEIVNSTRKDRNYKISNQKLKKYLQWQPSISIEKSVVNLIRNIEKHKNDNFTHPRYYNIEWMKLLTEVQDIFKTNSKIF